MAASSISLLSLFPPLALLALLSSSLTAHASPELVRQFCEDIENPFDLLGSAYCRKCLVSNPRSKDVEYNALIDILIDCGVASANSIKKVSTKLAVSEADPKKKTDFEFCADNTRWGTSLLSITREYLTAKDYRAGSHAAETAQESGYWPCVKRFGEAISDVPKVLSEELQYFYYICDDTRLVLINLADNSRSPPRHGSFSKP